MENNSHILANRCAFITWSKHVSHKQQLKLSRMETDNSIASPKHFSLFKFTCHHRHLENRPSQAPRMCIQFTVSTPSQGVHKIGHYRHLDDTHSSLPSQASRSHTVHSHHRHLAHCHYITKERSQNQVHYPSENWSFRLLTTFGGGAAASLFCFFFKGVFFFLWVFFFFFAAFCFFPLDGPASSAVLSVLFVYMHIIKSKNSKYS